MIKKTFATLGLALVIALSFVPQPTRADLPAVTPCNDSVSTAVVCKSVGPGVFFGIINNSLSAQTVSIVLYDNASACTGTVVYNSAAMGASQVVLMPGGGRKVLNGLTACASGTPIASGFDIYVQ